MSDNASAAAFALTNIAPGVRRLTAANASAMTGPGSNTYIVGRSEHLVLDPAVDEPAYRRAIRAAAGDDIAAIALTHRHPDHARGAEALSRETGAPICAWPVAALGRYDVETRTDRSLADGARLWAGGDLTLEAVYTPGHAVDHLCFFEPVSGVLFAGDMVMTDATVAILPPDGRMSDYFDSLARLQRLAPALIAPGHGALITAPGPALAAIVAHRQQREAQILAALDAERPTATDAVTDALYPRLAGDLRKAATAQVEAHLIRLAELASATRHNSGWRRLKDR